MVKSGLDSQTESLRWLTEQLVSDERLVTITECLASGQAVTIDSVWGSVGALLAAALAHEAPHPLLVVGAHANELDDVVDELRLFGIDDADVFPALEASSADALLLDDAYGQRLRVLKRLANSDAPGALVTSIQALMQPVPAMASLLDHSRQLRCGATVSLDDLARWLTDNGYHHTTAVELPGEFSLRGGILDIFATDWLDPVRIETFGDDVESIRRFEVSSQRSLCRLETIEVTVLETSTAEPCELTSYLAPEHWVLANDIEKIQAEGEQFLRRQEDVKSVWALSNVLTKLAEHPVAYASALSANPEPTAIRLPLESVERFGGDVADVRRQFDAIASDQTVLIVTETEAESQRLSSVLAKAPVPKPGDSVLLVDGCELVLAGPAVRCWC